MGFALFTSSGTFNPGTYGLTPGDLIHIKCVGGGAGGGSNNGTNYAPGGAGQASSFGSILSAAGGSVPSVGSRVNPLVAGSDPGGPGSGEAISLYSQSSSYTWTYTFSGCGTGGGGWHPQYGFVPSPPSALPFIPFVSGGGALYAQLSGSYPTLSIGPQLSVADPGMAEKMLYGRHVSMANTGTATASTLPFGYAGGGGRFIKDSTHVAQYAMSAGGIGYGAGGGGGGYYNSNSNNGSASANGAGGNGGVIADLDYILPNSNSYTITVGNGGNGHPGSGAYLAGGGGARGCVAIWW